MTETKERKSEKGTKRKEDIESDKKKTNERERR
jgi:hypothetical protein